MKITDIKQAARNPNRVNVSVDGRYRFSLDIAQLADLGIKAGQEISDAELAQFDQESQFGKLYAKTLEYSMLRPRSVKELRNYLYRQTLATKYRSRKTGEVKQREGVASQLTDRVFDRLVEKGYVDDEKFANWWVESRFQVKGISRRRLIAELRSKGVVTELIEQAFAESERDDAAEIEKVIAKKQRRYPDRQKLMQYLASQGFGYDDIKRALDGLAEED